MAQLGLKRALQLGDLDRAAAWLVRFEPVVAETLGSRCAPGYADLGGLEPESACRSLRDERDLPSSWLAAEGVAPPVSWRASLMATVRRCGAAVAPPDAAITAEAAFDGVGWRWRAWSEPGALARCIEGSPIEAPLPPDGVEVRLTVLPPR